MTVRLGDVIDDYCIKCRRLTNHSVVSILNEQPAKMRCRTCYNEHDYRHEEIPPSRRDVKKKELFDQVLASTTSSAAPEPEIPTESEATTAQESESGEEPAIGPDEPKGRARKARS